MSFTPEPALHAPILILGMHRSGTALVARMLEDLGVFMGWRLQGDHEALFFLGLNDWLLEQCRCGWDNPAPIQWLIRDPAARAAARDYLQLSLHSPRVASYLGPRQYLMVRTPGCLDRPWGWKDPRTTFTLPLWLDFFPNARLIHVVRHGVDVAASLSARHERIIAQRRTRFARISWLYRLRARRSRITTSVRVSTLEAGFSLWEEYVDAAEAALEAHAGSTLAIRYEDLLHDPVEGLGRAAKFCELPVSDRDICNAAGTARPDRAFAFKREPALRAFAEENAERLAARGY